MNGADLWSGLCPFSKCPRGPLNKSLGSKLKSNTDDITTIKVQITEIQSAFKFIGTSNVSEMEDRISRKNNIINLNMPEKSGKCRASGRIVDLNVVNSLIGHFGDTDSFRA